MPKDKTLIFSLALLAVLVMVLLGLTQVTEIKQEQIEREEGYAKIEVTKESNTNDSNTEYIEISIAPPNNQSLVATGWNIKGVKYNLSLGKASNLFAQGLVNDQAPIVLSKESRLIISTGHSPIGVSFRENKCTGILGLYQKFTPSLTPSCENCVGTTEYPEYNLCVETHKSDPDFFSNTWRLYAGVDSELWRSSLETIRLYDQEGKLITLKNI